MVLKKFFDYGGYYWGWKCARCGEMNDQMISQALSPKVVPQSQKGQIKGANVPR